MENGKRGEIDTEHNLAVAKVFPQLSFCHF